MAALTMPSIPRDELAPPPSDSPSASRDRALPSPYHCLFLSANKCFLHELVSRISRDYLKIFQPVRPCKTPY